MNPFQLILVVYGIMLLLALFFHGVRKLVEVLTDIRDDHIGAYKTQLLWIGLAIGLGVYLIGLAGCLYLLVKVSH